MKISSLLILPVLIIISCSNSKTTKMSNNNEPNQSKQESISGYAPVNGIKMYYEIHGEGKPVVLIHGGGSTIESTFGKILPLLATRYKVIAIELQAHGRTSDRNAPESFMQDANDVASLLQYLKISKADIIGFSNGGQTAMQIGITHSEVVNKLVLISAFYQRDGAFAGFFDSMPNATIENMPAPLKTAYLKVYNDPQGLQTMFEKDKQRMVDFKDWADEQLKSITAPTFIVAGDRDVVTLEHAAKMSRLIPGARLMVLPGTHGSFIGEICSAEEGSKMPEMTIRIIEEFLDKPTGKK